MNAHPKSCARRHSEGAKRTDHIPLPPHDFSNIFLSDPDFNQKTALPHHGTDVNRIGLIDDVFNEIGYELFHQMTPIPLEDRQRADSMQESRSIHLKYLLEY